VLIFSIYESLISTYLSVLRAIFVEILKQNVDNGRNDCFPLIKLLNMDLKGFEKKVVATMMNK
jgi:hypothetical protein